MAICVLIDLRGGAVADGTNVTQDSLTRLALFSRCYSHLTGRHLPHDQGLRAQVAAGTLAPVDACMQLLANAQLQPTSSNATNGLLSHDTPETRAVLLTLNNLHRSWFASDNFQSVMPVGECWPGSYYLHDQSEAALHVTRAALAPDGQFKDIVTGSSAMMALRSPNTMPSPLPFIQAVTPGVFSANTTPFSFTPVQTGDLVGVRRIQDDATIRDQTINMAFPEIKYRGNAPTDPLKVLADQSGSPTRIHQSLGGGIIGTKSYLMLNWGRPEYTAQGSVGTDGGLKMGRRWAKAVLGDLLCRPIPPVRITDALPFVQMPSAPQPQGPPAPQPPPFRNMSSCMSCHSSLDPMAATARGVIFSASVATCSTGVDSMDLFETMATQPRGPVQPAVSDPLYFARPPEGRLYYRSYDGTLVNDEVTGVAALGAAIASHNDLYVCAASRYFQFFTGIQVNLQDSGDPGAVPLSPADQAYRDRVVALGLDFKQHQSIAKLIRAILESDIYQRVSMRDPGSASQ